jgi:hypothetical protein
LIEKYSVAGPDLSGIQCFFDHWIMDPDPGSGMEKNDICDPGSRIRKNIPDHISKRLETIFWVKNT